MAGCLNAYQLTYTREQRALFHPLTFEMHTGAGYEISGKNGSGKSTLLKIAAGIFPPSGGNIRWNHVALNKEYQQNIAYLGHENGLKLGLTIEENWLNTLALHSCNTHPDLLTLLETFQLPQKTLIKHLSAGQKRKSALATFAFVKKNIWILDEPFNNVDAHGKELFNTLIKIHLNNQGLILLSTPEGEPSMSSFERIHLC